MEDFQLYLDWLGSAYNAVYPTLHELLTSENVLMPLAGLAVVAAATATVVLEKAMLAGHRHRWVKGILAMRLTKQQKFEEALVWGLENSVHNGWMTASQVRARYRELGQKLGLNGLILRSKVYRKLRPHELLALHAKTDAALSDPFNQQTAPLPKPKEAPTKVAVIKFKTTSRKAA